MGGDNNAWLWERGLVKGREGSEENYSAATTAINQAPFQHLCLQIKQPYNRIYFPISEIPARRLGVAGLRAGWETAAGGEAILGVGTRREEGRRRGAGRGRGDFLLLLLTNLTFLLLQQKLVSGYTIFCADGVFNSMLPPESGTL